MGRRGGSALKKFKAWPLLLILAVVYWGQKYLGITDIADLNTSSSSALPLALVLMAFALVWLFLAILSRIGREKDEDAQDAEKRR